MNKFMWLGEVVKTWLTGAVNRGLRAKSLEVQGGLPGRLLMTVMLGMANLALVNLTYPEWALIHPAFIDNWIYWGTGEAFSYSRDWFHETYYFRRWPIIFPYLILNEAGVDGTLSLVIIGNLQLFAVFVLTHIYLSSFGNRFVASSTLTFVIVSNPLVLLSIGNGYYSGSVLIASLVALNLLRAEVPQMLNGFTLVVAGFSIGVGLASYQALLLSAPIFLWGLLTRKGDQRPLFQIGRLRDFLGVGFGGAASLFFDSVVGQILAGGWENLASYSLRVAGALNQSGDWGISPESLLSNMLYSGWSLIPLLILCLALVVGSRTPNFLTLSAGLSVLLTLVLHLVVSLRGGNPLFVHTVLIFFFLLLLITSGLFIQALSRESRAGEMNVILIFVVAVQYFFVSGVRAETPWIWATAFVGVSFFLFSFAWSRIGWKRRPIRILPIYIWVFCFSLVTYLVSNHIGSDQGFETAEGFETPEEMYLAIEGDVAFSVKIWEETDARVWIQDNRSWPGWSPVISSLYGLYSAVSVDPNPSQLDCNQVGWITSQEKSVLVVFDSRRPEVVTAELEGLFRSCRPETNFGLSQLSETGAAVIEVR